MSDIPVKVHCPITKAKEKVYFHPFQKDAAWLVSKDSFTGCDNQFHACPACDSCKTRAWEQLFKED